MTAIALDGVTLGYGARSVLRDVSLVIEAGEFVGLLGPNGAGKTTLLRAILGLVPPRAGRIAVFGRTAAPGVAAIGYVPQARTAMPHLRARDVLALAAGPRWGAPWSTRGAVRDVEHVLDLVEGRELADRPLDELSGGERQRLLLAQALLGRPRLLLLDEPLISLDPRHQQGVVALVRRLQAELGLTVLFSAHELNPLLGALDRVLYVGAGQAAIGSVDTVVTAPVLSRLYGAPIEVVRTAGRVFVLLDGVAVEHEDHRHEAALVRL